MPVDTAVARDKITIASSVVDWELDDSTGLSSSDLWRALVAWTASGSAGITLGLRSMSAIAATKPTAMSATSIAKVALVLLDIDGSRNVVS